MRERRRCKPASIGRGTIGCGCVVIVMAKAKAKAAPRGRKLKVFKTPIGFHDAYVAAPSRKAALEAWGASTDLFSAGIAEPVTDAGEGAKAALAKPGEVVRIARHAEKDRPSPRPSAAGGKGERPAKAARPKPKPSRAALGKAEAALAALEDKQAVERAEIASEEEKLAKKRRAMEQRHARARDKAEAARAAVESRYRRAMAEWVG